MVKLQQTILHHHMLSIIFTIPDLNWITETSFYCAENIFPAAHPCLSRQCTDTSNVKS